MNSSSSRVRRNEREIEDEVTNLSEEDVGRLVSGAPVLHVWIGIYQPDGSTAETVGEVTRCSDGGYAIRIANQLGVVVINDVCRDHVRASRKVYNGRSCSARLAYSWCATPSTSNGCLNSGCIICGTIS